MCHDTHIGVEGCIRPARECLFWSCMATELEKYISKCDVYQMHQLMPQKGKTETIPRHWSKVSVDLCDLHGRTLLVACDYFRAFKPPHLVLCEVFKVLFARYGEPDVFLTDNGPQFSAAELAKMWNFQHHTSSPQYLQSDGKVENAV